jgi:ribonuclease R
MAKSKKEKNTRATFAKNIINAFMENPSAGMNYRQLSAKLGMKDKASRELLQIFMERLLAEGMLLAMNRGKYKLSEKAIEQAGEGGLILSGTIDLKASGMAFVTVEGQEDDIFIAPGNTGHALNGDTVKLRVYPARKGGRPEGKVIAVLARGKEQFVGTLQATKYYGIFTADAQNMPIDILVPTNRFGGARHGDKVVVKITNWPEDSENPQGEVVRVLGKPGVHEVEMQSIIVDFGFPLEFPAAVEKEADKIPTQITEAEIGKRRDFRKIFTLTIDPEDAKDFDDALSLRKTEQGLWEVGVHIADVSHYVSPGSKIDAEALERATSVYLVDRTIPMLPEVLSNNLCSLRPHEDKLCFSAVFEMNDEAEISKEWYGKTIIHSERRFNYDEVQQIIESGKGDFAEEIGVLNALATSLRNQRFKNGSIAFETEEVRFKLDEKGKPVSAFVKEYKDSNRLIEDFMLLANRKVAEHILTYKKEKQHPVFVYRIHDKPNPEKLTQFNEFIGKLGYQIKTTTVKSMSQSFNQLFDKIKGKGEENLISNLAVRTMAKAVYSTTNIGHYGLAFKHYTHFTSPIRRYPDLMVHRMLQTYLSGKASFDKAEYEKLCQHCSDMERKATEAERASIKYKQAEYLLDKVGQDFFGLISGVSKWGLYVELEGTKCEGMIALRDMNDDYYVIDEDNYTATGQSRGKKMRLGDRIKVKVKKIDLHKKTIDFVFAR